ncbi:MAG: outer membrane lipoprotein-sorting protein [Cytophagales bacterium]|nr:outer membrane lipoprotein-sorting protein [Armatimonadota bacterium]
MKTNHTRSRRVARMTLLTLAAGFQAAHLLTPVAAARTAPAAPAPQVSPETVIATRTTDRIKNLSTTLVVKDDETNREELKKIGGAFATTYSVKRMSVAYQYPNKARFEGKLAGLTALLVYNGNTKMFRVPIPLVGKKVLDVKGQPGQKQSLIDLGIFARDWLTTDWEPHFIGRQNGLDQYKLTQRDTDNTSYDLVWVNPKNYIIERRRSYNGERKLQKEIRFRSPVQIQPGIWVPTRIEVLNQFGKVGAVQTLVGTRVNAGVSDSLFQIG